MNKVSFGKNNKGSKIARISLKVKELEEIGITENEPFIKVVYTEFGIIIKKCYGRDKNE